MVFVVGDRTVIIKYRSSDRVRDTTVEYRLYLCSLRKWFVEWPTFMNCRYYYVYIKNKYTLSIRSRQNRHFCFQPASIRQPPITGSPVQIGPGVHRDPMANACPKTVNMRATSRIQHTRAHASASAVLRAIIAQSSR